MVADSRIYMQINSTVSPDKLASSGFHWGSVINSDEADFSGECLIKLRVILVCATVFCEFCNLGMLLNVCCHDEEEGGGIW